MAFPQNEVTILQDLARQVAEIAARPEEQAKADRWRRFNSLKQDRPMVLIFPEGSWREAMPRSEMLCQDPVLGGFEWQFRTRIYYDQHLRDDSATTNVFYCPTVCENTGWGVQATRRHSNDPLGAVHFEPIIEEEGDFAAKIHQPKLTVDWPATHRMLEQTQEMFDGILDVRRRAPVGSGMAVVDMFAQWRGLDRLFLDMVDRPEWLHECLQFLTDGFIGQVRQAQEQGALTLNNETHYVGSGGVAFTDELPQKDFDGEHVRPIDLWGFATTQIFSEVSPAMHEEFALTYEIQFLQQFGLNCYGCCEPLHRKMDAVWKIPRLRRVSMSPWVDLAMAAQSLGDRCVFSRKPNPAMLASVTWNEDAVRKSTREDLDKTRGCVVELIMKDTHTVNNDPRRLSEWVRIAREESDRFAMATA